MLEAQFYSWNFLDFGITKNNFGGKYPRKKSTFHLLITQTLYNTTTMPPADARKFIDNEALASGDDTDEDIDQFDAADTGDDTDVEPEDDDDGQDEKESVDLGSSSSSEEDDWTAVTTTKVKPEAKASEAKPKIEPPKAKAKAKPEKPKAKAPVVEKPKAKKEPVKSPRKSSQQKARAKAPVEKPTIEVQSESEEKPPEDKPKGKGKKAPPKSKAFADDPVDERKSTREDQARELKRFVDKATKDAQTVVANAITDQASGRKVRGYATLGGTEKRVVTDDALEFCKEYVASFNQVPHTVDEFFNAKRKLEEEGYTVQASITGAPSKRSKSSKFQ